MPFFFRLAEGDVEQDCPDSRGLAVRRGPRQNAAFKCRELELIETTPTAVQMVAGSFRRNWSSNLPKK